MRLKPPNRYERLESRDLLAVDSVEVPVLNLQAKSELRLADEGDIQLAALQFDADQDGNLDFVVADNSFAGVSVFLGDGTGAFAPPQAFAFPGEITSLTIADFNGDTFIDIVGSSSAGASVLLNQATTDELWAGYALTAFVAGRAESVAAGDLDGDQLDDLVIGQTDRVQVYFGLGDGEFGGPTSYTTDQPGERIVRLGDANNDGSLDLFAAFAQSHEVAVLLNDGSGVLEAEADLLDLEQQPAAFELADINGDQQIDILVGHSSQEGGNLSIWPGNANGTFDPAVRYEVLGPVEHIDVGYFDQDDAVDLLIAHGGTFHHPVNGNGPGGTSVMISAGDGTFFEPIRTHTPGTVATFMGDVNNDGLADIMFAEKFGGLGAVALQSPDGVFADRALDYQLGMSTASQFADLNDDGRQDYVSVTQDSLARTSKLRAVMAQPDGTYTNGPEIVVESLVNFLVAGDFDGDDGTEIGLLGFNEDIEPILLTLALADDGETFETPQTTALDGRIWTDTQVADFNQDGADDLISVVTDDTEARLQTLLGGPSAFVPAERVLLPTGFTGYELGYLDGDDQLDVGISETSLFTSGSFQPLLGNGDGFFEAMPSLQAGGLVNRFGDFNGDGATDLLFLSGLLSVSLSVSYGNGLGGFSDAIEVLTSESFFTFEVADINRDGRSDFIYGDSIVYGQTDGFSEATALGLGFNSGDLVQADVNGDKVDDLLVSSLADAATAASSFATLTELLQTDNGDIISMSQHHLKIDGLQSLHLEDVDDDGDLDALLLRDGGFSVIVAHGRTTIGDLNGDTVVDSADIDHLCQQLGSNVGGTAYDLNRDGAVDRADVDYLVESVLGTVAGDADLDGQVGFSDFLQLGFFFGQTGHGWAHGDFTCDGVVAFDDFLLLSANFESDGNAATF